MLSDGTDRLRGYLWIVAAVLLLTAALSAADPTPFARFMGPIPPLLALPLVAGLGFLLLRYLNAAAGLRIHRPGARLGWPTGPLLALGLAALMAAMDTVAPLPRDINVPFPAALAFYPSIAFVVEVVFHLVPLAAAVGVVGFLRRSRTGPPRLWPLLLGVALLEPTFQTVLASPDAYPLWQTAYVAVHIYAINGVQLWLFARHDFLSMFAFRLVYYLGWHIVWGALRLELLF